MAATGRKKRSRGWQTAALLALRRHTSGNSLHGAGKPYFPDSDLHFSVSHTKNHTFCCVSSKNIGIDAEECDRVIDLRLADKYLSPTEKQHFAAATDKRECLLRLWVLKEAYSKLLGKGIGNYLATTTFSPNDPRIQIIDGCFVAVIEDK